MRRRVLALTREQREELQGVRERDRRSYLRERTGALLRVAEGEAAHRVAVTGLLRPRQPDTVYAWLGRYERAGRLPQPRRLFSRLTRRQCARWCARRPACTGWRAPA